MPQKIDWNKAVQSLLKRYKNKKHPLEYKTLYELIVMVVLSAQSTDKLINEISVKLFKAYPDFQALSKASVEDLEPYIGKVRSFYKKAEWLLKIAQQLNKGISILISLDTLIKLPGIGRKSANVIMREAKILVPKADIKPEGIIVDLHVLRVAPRLGIAKGEDAKDVEQQMMKKLDEKNWDAGMAMSFLGREICRPTDPLHEKCVMNKVCAYYEKVVKKKKV